MIRNSKRWRIFSSRSICFKVFRFQIFSNDLSHHLFAKIIIHVSQSNFELKFENVFFFYFVFVLIINEHRMHVQKFAKKKRFFIIQNDAIFSHILCFNNFVTFEFKRKFFEKIFCFEKNDRFIILNFKYFWHSTIFANAKSNNLQKFFSSFSSISFQIFVRFHNCRVRYELNAFTNKSSRFHISSFDEKKNNELSFRNEIEKTRKIMWRTYIDFNI